MRWGGLEGPSAFRGADLAVHRSTLGEFDLGREIVPRGAVICVRTKADLGEVGRAKTQTIAVCAIDGWNLEILRHAIAREAWKAPETSAPLVPRHRRALGRTHLAIREALSEIDAGSRLANPEMVAGWLRLATDAMGELLGRMSPDEVLGRIFASFCVGK